jgi:hypothetical protein
MLHETEATVLHHRRRENSYQLLDLPLGEPGSSSPFFLITGAEPVMPLDVQEAMWLVEPPSGIMSTEDLIAARA